MSNKKCCVPGCFNSLGKCFSAHRRPMNFRFRFQTSLITYSIISDTNANLHKFPNPNKDKELFNTWVYSIGGDILQLENEYIFKYRRVCRGHFEQKYWCRNNRLSKEAVPTISMPG